MRGGQKSLSLKQPLQIFHSDMDGRSLFTISESSFSSVALGSYAPLPTEVPQPSVDYLDL
jgi:hypothetical protein